MTVFILKRHGGVRYAFGYFTIIRALPSWAIGIVIYIILFFKSTLNRLSFFFSSMLRNNIHNIKCFVG